MIMSDFRARLSFFDVLLIAGALAALGFVVFLFAG